MTIAICSAATVVGGGAAIGVRAVSRGARIIRVVRVVARVAVRIARWLHLPAGGGILVNLLKRVVYSNNIAVVDMVFTRAAWLWRQVTAILLCSGPQKEEKLRQKTNTK